MAVDEMLLEWVAQTGQAVWRWYAWETPTVSLGYFQDAADRALHAPSAGCAWVRRATGGGAIVHDAEWTYSCFLPSTHAAARHRDRLYRFVHEAFVSALATAGLNAEMVCCPAEAANSLGCAAESVRTRPPPYLCFQRRAPGDVLAGGQKILGSAQRRAARAVLQHGSLLLRSSAAAPELPGVCDLAARAVDLPSLREECLQRLGDVLGLSWTPGQWTAAMNERSTYWMGGQYATPAWNTHRRRGTPY